MPDTMGRPNFFIVGAPKSGTTSLHEYLEEHPEVFMSDPKEPSYLAPDFPSPLFCQTEAAYLESFRGYHGERRIGESSTSYLYSRMAARRIAEFAPHARIIAMIRNPVDMVPSLHAQYLKMGVEDICRFEDAIAAENERAAGKRLPQGFPFPNTFLLYRRVAKYAEQLERYFTVFGRENVHVVVFDDFSQNTEQSFAEICRFLDISCDFKPKFAVHNPTRIPRFTLLHRLAIKIRRTDPAILQRLHPALRSRFQAAKELLHQAVARANLRTKPASVAGDTRAALHEFYAEEVERLESLLQRTLSTWRQGVPRAL